MATRPRSRVRRPPARNMATPARMGSGASCVTLNDITCTISVVPTLAPSMTASAVASGMTPAAAKEATISPVAVLLCMIAVAPRPAAAAFSRLESARDRKRFSPAPKARCTPLCTM